MRMFETYATCPRDETGRAISTVSWDQSVTVIDLLITYEGLSWEQGLHEGLARNPIENRAIADFSGQKSGTRIIVSILQSFLTFS